MLVRLSCLAAAFVAPMLVTPMFADTLPSAAYNSFFDNCNAGGECSPIMQQSNSPGTISLNAPGAMDSYNISVTTSQYGGGGASFSANATRDYPQGQGTVTYYFEVSGPDSAGGEPILVPVNVTANGSVSAVHDGTATASLTISNSDNSLYDYHSVCASDAGSPTCTPNGTLSVSEQLLITPNQQIEVQLLAQGGINYDDAQYDNGTSSASIDPMFSIDPGFDDYSLQFSDGVTFSAAPTSGIPEPSTAALLSIGLGCGAYLVRKRARRR